jgi:acetyl-CoA carboxylase biotin carboxyl carrier protein
MASLDADGVQLDTEAFRSLCAEARDLIGRLERSSVQSITVELGEARLQIERAAPAAGAAAASPDAAAAAPSPGPLAMGAFNISPGARGASGAFAAITGEVDRRIPVLAPLVGTFYAAPQPGAKPFVEVGARVDVGDTVCIVEAMKLMNEVGAGEAGTVAEIVVENGERVEYEQVLMYLEPLDE